VSLVHHINHIRAKTLVSFTSEALYPGYSQQSKYGRVQAGNVS